MGGEKSVAMLLVNGRAVPAPSGLQVAVFDVSSGEKRNAAGNAVLDRSAVKRRLELTWAHISGADLAALLGEIGGLFEAAYPDPVSGQERSMQCYCSERIAGILRMAQGVPVWTDVKMIWTER